MTGVSSADRLRERRPKEEEEVTECQPAAEVKENTARTLRVKVAPYFAAMDKLPHYLRFGPWSPVAYLFLAAVFALLSFKWAEAKATIPVWHQFGNDSYPLSSISSANGILRLFGGVYMVLLESVMIWRSGHWPLFTFTMLSWKLLSARLLLTGFLSAIVGRSAMYEWPTLAFVSETLRFPALVCNSLTVCIWWIVLVPAIYYMLETPRARRAFRKFNTRFTLLNVHGLNLLVAASDHLSAKRTLHFCDLYAALFVAVAYVTMYLFVMEPMGLHFYHLILSPRPHWCFLLYSVVLSLFVLFFWLWQL